MIEVKDRIPTYPGRVRMTPVEGQPNTYDMVRADEPIEPGTPINKTLFENLASISNVTLFANGWTIGADGRYTQTVAVEGMTTAKNLVIVDCDLNTDDADARVATMFAWAFPSLHEVKQGDGTLTFYSSTIPSVSIPVLVGVI